MKRLRNYFFSGISGNLGRLFKRGNKPDEQAFKDLLDSTLFKTESGDTANETDPGHVKAETDIRARRRDNPHSDGHIRAIQAHQLPELSVINVSIPEIRHAPTTDNMSVVGDGVEIKSIVRTISGKSRRNYIVMLRIRNSLEITSDYLQLKGDMNSPGNNKYYGTNSSGSKGYHLLPGVSTETILTKDDILITDITPASPYTYLQAIERLGTETFTSSNVIDIHVGGLYLHEGTSRDYHFDGGVIKFHPGWKIDTQFVDIKIKS